MGNYQKNKIGFTFQVSGFKFRVSLAFFFSVSLALMPVLALAAELNLTSQTQEFGIGQQFQVDLMLDTEGEIINAIEGEIAFPKDLLEIKEIRDGDSIINLWVERPSIKSTDRVVFSGIIPTGFAGVLSPYYEGERPGKIFSLIFISRSEGEGTVDLKDGKVLLHDGLGTPANIKISNFQFLISKDVSGFEFQVPEDFDPPEEFKPEIAQSPEMFEGKYFLVFATQDKGSGIERYEIQETRNKRQGKNWVEVESPYVLKDQNLKSYIYVKAIDKAGNEKIVVIEPRYPLEWYENWWIWVIIILAIAIIIFMIIKFRKIKCLKI